MPTQQRVHSPKETTIERIFRKITGRKMTLTERACFHLNGASRQHARNGSNGAAPGTEKSRN